MTANRWTNAETNMLREIAAKHADDPAAALAAYTKRGGKRSVGALRDKAQQLSRLGKDLERKYAYACLARSLRRQPVVAAVVDPDPEWLPMQEARALAGIRRVTFAALAKAGTFVSRSWPCGKSHDGKRYEYSASSIREWKRGRKVTEGEPTPPPHVTYRQRIAEAEAESPTPATAMPRSPLIDMAPSGVAQLADAVHRLVKTYEQVPRADGQRELIALTKESVALQRLTIAKLDTLITLWEPAPAPAVAAPTPEPEPSEPAPLPPDMLISTPGVGRLVTHKLDDLRNGVAKP